MRKSVVLPLAILGLALNSGCATQKRVSLSTAPTAQQNSAFMRGGVKLSSKTNKLELTVVDYSYDEMVLAISIANNKSTPILFSEKNLSSQHWHSNQKINAKIYSYEELLAEYSDSSYSTMVQVGQTATRIGTNFIPFGSIAMSLGNLLFSLSEQGISHKDRINSLVASQLSQMYLRQHTIEPKAEYGGIMKIGFSEQLAPGDKVLVNVALGDKTETFTFVCE